MNVLKYKAEFVKLRLSQMKKKVSPTYNNYRNTKKLLIEIFSSITKVTYFYKYIIGTSLINI